MKKANSKELPGVIGPRKNPKVEEKTNTIPCVGDEDTLYSPSDSPKAPKAEEILDENRITMQPVIGFFDSLETIPNNPPKKKEVGLFETLQGAIAHFDAVKKTDPRPREELVKLKKNYNVLLKKRDELERNNEILQTNYGDLYTHMEVLRLVILQGMIIVIIGKRAV